MQHNTSPTCLDPRSAGTAGLSYWQISDQTTAGTFDRTACLWFSMSVVTLQPSANAVSIFNQERDVLRRELSNGKALRVHACLTTCITAGLVHGVACEPTNLLHIA